MNIWKTSIKQGLSVFEFIFHLKIELFAQLSRQPESIKQCPFRKVPRAYFFPSKPAVSLFKASTL
jgi:hypothetical protein